MGTQLSDGPKRHKSNTAMTDLKYTKHEDHITIKRGSRSASSITIPSKIDGLPVTKIGRSAFRECEDLESVTIPNSVTHIGRSAFRDCSSLMFVRIPDTVTHIGRSAFKECSSLTFVTMPDSITSFGGWEFEFCFRLTIYGTAGSEAQKYAENAKIPFSTAPLPYCDAAGNWYSHDGKTILGIPHSHSGEFVVPDGVTEIGAGAFNHCCGLTSITFSDSVTRIGEYAFYWCDNLTSVTIPDSVTHIGQNAFCVCKRLTSVTLPNSITHIEKEVFYYCPHLTTITIPNSVTSIGTSAFGRCGKLTSVTIPDSVTHIGKYAFSQCRSLSSVIIPASVTHIEEGVFYWHGKLTIYGTEGSEAQRCAESCGISFSTAPRSNETHSSRN